MDYINDFICRIYEADDKNFGEKIRKSYRCGNYQETLGWLSANISPDEHYEIFQKVNA